MMDVERQRQVLKQTAVAAKPVPRQQKERKARFGQRKLTPDSISAEGELDAWWDNVPDQDDLLHLT